MKQFRKLTAVLLALLMAMAYVPVMAEEAATYELRGDSSIYAPYAGRKASVAYKLEKTVGEEVSVIEDAELSISGDIPSGVKVSDDKKSIVLDGDSIKPGSFTVTATKGEETAEKVVTVEDILMYNTFDNLTEGETVYFLPAKLSDGSVLESISTAKATATKEAEGDMYASNGHLTLTPEWAEKNWKTATAVTVEFDFCYNKSGAPWMIQGITDSGNIYQFTMQRDGSGVIQCNGTPADFTCSDFALTYKVRVEYDYCDRECTFFINDQNYGTYAMGDKTTTEYIKQLKFVNGGDNIAVYSGTAVTAQQGQISGETSLYAPPSGVKSAVKYSLSDAEGNPVNGATWSIEGTANGVSVDNNGKLTLDGSSITNGTFTLVAKTDFVEAKKDITINNVRIFEDFTDQTAGEVFKMKFTNLNGTSAENPDIPSKDATITTENDGNNYVAMGSQGGAGIILRWGSSEIVSTKNAGIVTVSYKVKGDGKFYDSRNYTFSVGFSEGKFNVPENNVIGELAPSGWTNVRLIFDYTDKANYPNGKFKAYVNDALSFENIALGELGNFPTDFYFSADFDDFAIYSGEAVVGDYLTVNDVAYVSGSSVLASGNNNISAHLEGVSSGNKMFIMAHYNGDVLVDCNVFSSPYEAVTASLYNVNGGKVRIFLWDENLVPMEITTIATEIN